MNHVASVLPSERVHPRLRFRNAAEGDRAPTKREYVGRCGLLLAYTTMKQILLLLTLALAVGAHAAESKMADEKSRMTAPQPGLRVGARAPDFTLSTSADAEVTLRTLLAKGPVALAFVRSADWCPFCRKQLEALQKDLSMISTAGVQLLAVSYDAPATNAAAAKKLGLTFPLLSDVGSKVIDAYGIRNQEAKGRSAGVPHPVVFIIDREGMIRGKLMRDNYRDRPESAEIIAGARGLM